MCQIMKKKYNIFYYMADLNDIDLCKDSIITISDIIEKLNNKILLIEKNMLDIIEKNKNNPTIQNTINEKPIIEEKIKKNIIESPIETNKIETNKIEINKPENNEKNNTENDLTDIKILRKKIIRSRRRIN